MDNWFTLEPRDVLLVRDGRAMNGTLGRSLAIPHLPTIGGLVRSRLGRRKDGSFDASRTHELLQVPVTGPLIAQLDGDGTQVVDVLAPAPSDCVWFNGASRLEAHRLHMRRITDIVAGATSDLGDDVQLATFGGGAPITKPAAGPRWWRWKSLLEWLERPPAAVWDDAPAEVGVDDFDRERRTHVAIDSGTQTAEDGALFQTEGRRLVTFASRGGSARTVVRYALLARSGTDLEPGLVPLGGERSAAFLRTLPVPDLSCPAALRRLEKGANARVVLLTPAIFAEGSVPATIHGARVIAAHVDRPDVVSGWDFAENRPKPTRRMAPAGSVYWVEVPDAGWAARAWLEPASTDAERRDGFGLTVVGVAR